VSNLDGLLETSINRISSRLSTVELEFMRLAGTRLAEIGIFSHERAKAYLFSAEYLGGVNSDLNIIKRKLSQAHRENERDMGILSNDITATVYSEGASLGKEKGKVLSPKKEYQAAVNPMLNSIMRNYRAMEKSTAAFTEKTYRDTIRKYVNKLTIDEDRLNFPTAMRSAITELTANGISFVRYEGKRATVRRMDSSVRTALMGEYTQIVQGIQGKLAEDIGADGVEISAHQHCAEDHAPFQGHTFTSSEFEKLQNGEVAEDIDGEKFQTDRAIGQYNCRHLYFPVLLGISEPSFSKSELEAINTRNEKGFTYNGQHLTLYQGEQMQRRIETELRRNRGKQEILKSVAGSDPAFSHDLAETRNRIRVLRAEYDRLGDTLEPYAIRAKRERTYNVAQRVFR